MITKFILIAISLLTAAITNGQIEVKVKLSGQEVNNLLKSLNKKIENIRELENCIQRNVVLAKVAVIELESCNWKISGKGSAAEILDVNVNTLNSRIKKLGIEKEINATKC